MSKLFGKSFEEADEVVSLPRLNGQIVLIDDTYVARYVHHPGWRWSVDMQSLAGTPRCQFHHQGLVLSGHCHVIMEDGAERTLGPDDVFNIPPGHDAWVVGDIPFVTLEFRGARDWARPSVSGERILATLLFTDLVSSTARLAQIGDSAWSSLLERHSERVRLALDRYRGYRCANTGDGFLALFDGAARAVCCARDIRDATRIDGLEVRVGIHCGEVERFSHSVQGLAVHTASRVMAQAGTGEILISASTLALLEGSNLNFCDAGEFEQKGLPGKRHLYRLC